MTMAFGGKVGANGAAPGILRIHRGKYLARSAKLRRLFHNHSGNVAVMAALCLPLILGGAGLGVDTIQWVLAKRQLQGAVDGAAISGVYSALQSADAQAAAEERLAKSHLLDPRGAVLVENPAPGHEDDPFAVHVQVTIPAQLSFSGLFLSKPPLLTADATATVVQNGTYCAFALGAEPGTGVLIAANAELKGNCGIASNATSNMGIEIEHGASVEVARLVSAGAIDGDPIASGSARSFALSEKDPLEDTEAPPIPKSGCPNVTVNGDDRQSVSLEPGCYGNMILNGSVHLQDGEYILNRGSFIAGATANISCESCTIILTSDDPLGEPGSIGNIRINQNATIKLTAPTEGADAGILFYQDRHAEMAEDSDGNRIAGNGFSKLQGLIYAPAQTVRVTGDPSSDLSCARFVGKRLILEGRIYISSDCSQGNVITLRGTEVRLIG